MRSRRDFPRLGVLVLVALAGTCSGVPTLAGFMGNLYDVAIFTGALNSTEIAHVKSGNYSEFMVGSPVSLPGLGLEPLLGLGTLLGLAGIALVSRRSNRS
jgi:hypothetical protein